MLWTWLRVAMASGKPCTFGNLLGLWTCPECPWGPHLPFIAAAPLPTPTPTPFPGPEDQLLPGVLLLLPQTCLGQALGNLKVGLGTGRVQGLDRPGRGTGGRGGGGGPGPATVGDAVGGRTSSFACPLGLSAGTRTRRLGSHDALCLKWHLLPLSCLSWRSGSCHVRRAAPALCLLPSALPRAPHRSSPRDPPGGRAGAGAWGRPATGGGGGPRARLQANQFGN